MQIPFGILGRIGSVVGFVAAVLGIGEWTGYFPGLGIKDKIQATQTGASNGATRVPDPTTDEGRLQILLADNITCPAVSLNVSGVERRDTPASETSSGQPATYLEAFVQVKHPDNPKRIEAIGSGRGPGGEGQAFTRLLESMEQQIEETYAECSKG